MLLRFIGEDGSMGLRKGKVYNCSVEASGFLVWITWDNKGLVNSPCPYNSFKKLFENWEEISFEER